ncbi:hypothetical protein BDZ89DRAFT_969172 [Hymenopellis radicata]|nr:hypothetical protein BDZ89DRAFT_969172 [Hymenopellis radicata]
MCTQARTFPSPAVGISHGGGELAPGNRALSKKVRVFMESLIRNPAFIRWAGHVNRAFEVHNPTLHREYADNLNSLQEALPHLRRNFKNSPFACMTVNCGPRVVCDDHTDSANKPDGWCAVTPAGRFNSRKGGHLVLWDLKLIIEFPAGCTIFLPSALLRHSNLPIQLGETRYSITQYSAGGLFAGCITEGVWTRNSLMMYIICRTVALWVIHIILYSLER